MFFQLSVHGITRSDLGWILSKHPDNVFNREIKKGRSVEAYFGLLLPKEDKEQEGVSYYSYKGKNDPVHFMEIMKIQNSASYVHPSISCISPYNLHGFRETFKSTLGKKYGEESSKHNDSFHIEAVIGPWPFDLLRVQCRYAEVGIKVSPHPSLPYTAILDAPSMRVDEFLQKVYCIAYILTDRITALGREELRVSLTSFFVDWVDSIKDPLLRKRLAKERDPAKLKQQRKEQQEKEKEKEKSEKQKETEKGKQRGKGKGKGKEKEQIKKKEAEEEEGEEEEEEDSDEGEEDPHTDSAEGAEVTTGDNVAEVIAPPKVKADCDDCVVGKVTLHQRRHEFIMGWLKGLYPTLKDQVRILDYGCARGHLTVAMANLLTEASFVAMDANPWVGKTKAMKSIRRITYLCCNLLYPPNPSSIMSMDVVVFCEVIEHFDEKSRAQLMKIIMYLIRPKHIVITSPNIAYNPLIPNMKTRFRHPEHKIEYTYEEWSKEVLRPLEGAGYKITEHKLLPEEEQENEKEGEQKKERIQPSFVVTAERIEGWTPPHRKSPPVHKIAAQLNAELSGMHDPMWLPRNQVLMDHKKLNAGYSSAQYISYANDFFAAAPTMAPVDYREPSGEEKDFLEHPEAAFAYYSSFGLTRLVAERKYMGSRAQILAFRSDKCPKEQQLIKIITRNGAPFFTNDTDGATAMMFHKELDETMKTLGYDWVILDGEMLPWIAKGGALIESSFRKPGELALVSRKVIYGEDSIEFSRAKEFVQALEWHIQNTPLEYRMFQILAAGRISKLGDMEHSILGDYVEAQKRYDMIKKFESEHIKSVEYRFIDLTSAEDMAAAVKDWRDYCASGGEGWVVKAYPTLSRFDEQGRLVLPMVKVRGREYLRLVYGIDYLEPKYFKDVSKRKIGPKRAVARKQVELADVILKCFIHGHDRHRMKAIAAFFGATEKDINATL